MRQVLHELRTPVNAIQGYAEMVQQQWPDRAAPHEYRALAAAIAGDGARILAGFDELDRLVKLDCGAIEAEPGECDLAEIVDRTTARLEAFLHPRGSGFALEKDAAPLAVYVSTREAERLVWRLLAMLAAATAPGEFLSLRLRARDGEVRLGAKLPAALAPLDDDALFQASAPEQAPSASIFGAGFVLRLAAAEAGAAGGSLIRDGEKLALSLPGLTGSANPHSDDAESLAPSTH
jgi:hypothetical protein